MFISAWTYNELAPDREILNYWFHRLGKMLTKYKRNWLFLCADRVGNEEVKFNGASSALLL